MQQVVEGTRRVAAIQMASGPRIEGNQQEIRRLLQIAAAGGAELVVLPENAMLMGMAETDKLAFRETDEGGPLQGFFAAEAARLGIWIIAGTIPMAGVDPARARQSCLVFDAEGRRVARYDKIHLFDVDVEGDTAYRESNTLEPGSTVVTVDSPFGRIGLSVCYDLRFPEMYRLLIEHGADLLVVPSAFTAKTGEAHWRTLVRARAIENLCTVIAPNQGGYHVNGRETHGETMIVDSWGRILDSLSRGSGVVFGDIDIQRQRELRQHFPALDHRRFRVVEA